MKGGSSPIRINGERYSILCYGDLMRFLFFFFLLGATLFVGGFFALLFVSSRESVVTVYPKPVAHFWEFRTIDTMKHSRDLAREKLSDASYDGVIDRETRLIAETGVTHIAIATPYDEEFIPYLGRWVDAARRYDLKVWFRGNFSGWEEWFGYSGISRGEHLVKTRDFISNHGELFEDGDAFSSCPECENGGSGDPRQTGDVAGYRKFLIDEYEVSKAMFRKIGKRVDANYFSMNGDVARLVMDRETTEKLGGVVTVDHYVKTPEMLAKDAEDFIERSGGKLVLGEFGAPIPDIHGKMTEREQSIWLEDTLFRLSHLSNIAGVSYWTHIGSSTALWDDRGVPREAASALAWYYRPHVFFGVVRDELGRPIVGAVLSLGEHFRTETNDEGYFELLVPGDLERYSSFSVSVPGFVSQTISGEEEQMSIVLLRERESWWFRMEKHLQEWQR